MVNVAIFYGHLEFFYSYLGYFIAIWYILWTFDIFYGHLVYCMNIW
jgi:hypothetical protein